MPEVEKLRDEVAFYKRREADICAAVGGVADGGQYRADIIAAIVNLRNRERDAVLRFLRAEHDKFERAAKDRMLSEDSRDRCNTRAALLETEIAYIERGDHLTG